MDTICERFLQAERDFIVAARSNGSFLMDFAERWEALQSEWGSCLHEADHTTQQLVDGVAARIERLAEDLSMVRSHSMSLEEDLLHSLEEVFASLTLEDVVDCAGPASTEVSSFVGSRCADLPAEWLLRNLHNPYPPPHTRFSPDPTAGSKHMKDWFSKARQRIGWTRLLRDRFAGCRSLAIDAAFRAFVRDDPNNPLDPDLKTAFTAIKSHAELVYGDEDVTSPSPKRLRSISPTPSLAYSLSSEDTDDDQSPILPSEISSIHPLKRRLSETSGSFSTKRIRHCGSTFSHTSREKDAAPLYTKIPSPRPRKRRLSGSDSDTPRPKRPRGMEGDRLHAVSDPLCATTAPAWFSLDQSFQLPNPASTQPLELSSFDLDFYNPPSLPSCVLPPASALFSDNTALVDDFPALFEMPQLDLLRSTLPTFGSDWTEFLNFEPDLSLFPPSPSLASSSASTPPLIDDAILSPSSPSCGDPYSPDPVLDILPHFSEKGVQIPVVGGPIIQGSEFLFPPGEDAGIPSTSALLTIH